MRQWFARFGDIPAIEYHAPVIVDRTMLPEHAAHPDQYGFWPIAGVPERRSSGSPASQRLYDGDVQRVVDPYRHQHKAAVALECPGYPRDYALILDRVIWHLWILRAQAGWVLEALETWCRLGVRLAAIYQEDPSAFGDAPSDSPGVVGARTLIELYSREGYLREAIQIAEEVAILGYQDPELESIKMRLDNLRREHADE